MLDLFAPRGRWGHLPSIASRIEVADCWEWTAARTKLGYGVTHWEGRQQMTHRVVYQVLVGPVPEDLELDHLCRNPRCVNPDHLEPVSHQVNLLRGHPGAPKKTHCKAGHAFTPENSYPIRRGVACRRCRRRASTESARRRRQKVSI